MTDEEMVTVPRSDVYDPKGYLWRDQWKWAVERAEKAEARPADRRATRMTADDRDTLAALIGELRQYADDSDDARYGSLSTLLVRQYLDKIETEVAGRDRRVAAQTLRDCRAAVERQADLPSLMHFDRPSDFRKGVLSALAAVDALSRANTTEGTP